MAHQLGGQSHVDRLDGEVAAASHEAGAEGVTQHVRPEGFAVVGRPDTCCGLSDLACRVMYLFEEPGKELLGSIGGRINN